MDDKIPNFALVDLGLNTPNLAEIRRLRGMPGGWTEGECVHICGGFRARHSSIEMTFISRAFAASARKDQSSR